MELPVAERWYAVERLADRVTRLTEPHVHPLMRANIFLVEGRDRDLVVDAGMGVAPLASEIARLRADPEKRLALFVTHAHIDHVGAAHEFAEILVHPEEARELAAPAFMTTLMGADIAPELRAVFGRAGYPEIGETFLEALPAPGFDPARWRLRGAEATRMVGEGDVIDLGDRRLEVLHLPGHSPGQLGLWEAATGTLFGADALYDGPLIYDAPGMSVADYAATLRRLRDLPARTIHGGHDPSFGRDRMVEIIDRYLALWAA
jgi:glyoxylase-like metal-dependent hydrolase (beta-lactamase superfamily II)